MLEVRGLVARYGDLEALHGVDLTVGAADFVAVLGRNGAGKSTLVKSIAGLIAPAAGTISLDGKQLGGRSAAEVVRAGVAVVPEGRAMFAELTVRESLRVGAFGCLRGGWRTLAGLLGPSTPTIERRLSDVLDVLPELRGLLERRTGLLSGGQQQMVAVGRALMAEPRLLLVDELSLGLAPKVVASLIAHLRALQQRGIAVVLIEQNIHIALACSERAYVLETGQVRFAGPSEQLRRSPDVLRAYLELEVAEPA